MSKEPRQRVVRHGLRQAAEHFLLLGLVLGTLAACGDGRAGAEEWCNKKAVEIGGPLARAHQPSSEQASAGYDAFMRECMKNQGY